MTTTIRQHPLEGVIRYVFMAAFVAALGVSLRAFLVYRLASALNGLLEHANIRVPTWLDRALSWVTTWPNYHKVHHSRAVRGRQALREARGREDADVPADAETVGRFARAIQAGSIEDITAPLG